jgi:hypothetical protein
MSKVSYSGYRFPPEIIHQAIWLYLRFTLSLDSRGYIFNADAAEIVDFFDIGTRASQLR